jgi:hypothetical protein
MGLERQALSAPALPYTSPKGSFRQVRCSDRPLSPTVRLEGAEMRSAILEVHLFWVKLWSVERIRKFTYAIRRRRGRYAAH